MSEEKRCAQCGAILAANAPQGLCPACLLNRGFASSTGASESNRQGPRTEYVPPPLAELAQHFPGLEILGLIGRGGMGVVYKARQKRLDRLVALKILPSNVSRDPAFAERFAREAKALARLTHPNIVSIYDSGQTDGLFYFLMEFVDGMNLRQLIDSGKISPKEALAIVPQICDALQFAHDKGVVHRDIKPENILLARDGTVKIADFGLAKLVGAESKDLTITDKHDVMGTPLYMAPEQVEHPQDVDHRADIYSLGVVFYQMLTGELPIGRFAPPSRKVQIDVRLDEVVLRALEKEPEHRYQHASEVKTRVETIASTPSDSGEHEPSRTGSLGRIISQFVGYGAALLFACLVILIAMGSDSLGSKTWGYFRLGFEILAAAGSVGFLFAVYRAIRTPSAETWRTVKFLLPMVIMMVIGINFGFWSPRLLKPQYYVLKTKQPTNMSETLSFGPVIERVVEARQSGTNMFLDLDTGRLMTPPGEVINSLTAGNTTHDIDLYWQGLDIMDATRPSRYLSWLRESGVDLMFNDNGEVLAFDGVWAVAHGTNSVNWDSWDGLIPEMPRMALKEIEAAARATKSGVTIVSKVDGESYTSARHLYSRYGGPIVNQLTREQSMMWFFKTREGDMGILEISGFTDNPRGVKIRYKLVQSNSSRTSAPFVANYPGGTVELVALTCKPWTNMVCWRADGTISREPFPEMNGSMDVWSANMEVKKIAFRVQTNGFNDISCPVTRVNEESGVLTQGSAWQAPDRRSPDGLFVQMITCPTNTRTMNVSLGIASGPWETATTLNHRNNLSGAAANGEWSASFNAVTGKDGDVAVGCLYTKNADWETRLVYVNDEGKVIPIQENSSRAEFSPVGATLLVSSNEFARVKEFRLQKRSYHWAEFRNVSLQAGHRTTVEVKDFGVAAGVYRQNTAVQNWLALVDARAYPQSWEVAAESFHRAVTKEDWTSLLEKVRQPLGSVVSREEVSVQPSSALPGMPDGSYFVEQFATSFTGLTSAVETVTFSLEKDGQWKAVAYLIRPRTTEETAAVSAAQVWLAGIDSGHYAESWTDASEFFRNAITQDKWVAALQSVRAPLGDLKIRTVDSAVSTTSLPGAPYGSYVVMQFHTAFSKMKSATETVTFSTEKDGAWRASSYYIK